MHGVCSISSKNYDLSLQLYNSSLRQHGQCKVALNYYLVARRASTNHGTPFYTQVYGDLWLWRREEGKRIRKCCRAIICLCKLPNMSGSLARIFLILPIFPPSASHAFGSKVQIVTKYQLPAAWWHKYVVLRAHDNFCSTLHKLQSKISGNDGTFRPHLATSLATVTHGYVVLIIAWQLQTYRQFMPTTKRRIWHG